MVSIVAKRGLDLSTGYEESAPQGVAKRSCVRPNCASLDADHQTVWAPGGESAASAHTREVLTFLHDSGLLCDDSGNQPNMLSRAPCLWTEEEKAWFAVGELNLMHSRAQLQFSRIPILSYHSLTRSPRAAVFSKLCGSQCVYPQAVISNPSHSPRHLRMILHILDKAYASYSEASVTVSSFHLPTWLHEWCSRWGFPASSRARMTLYTVNAYPNFYQPTFLGTQPPVLTLLVPDFAHAATAPIH